MTENTPHKGTPPDLPSLIDGLARLRANWSRTRAGQGGLWAVAGFGFQFTKAVLEVVRAEQAGRGTVLVEALSDILRVDDGLIVAQLKRTLTSSALSSALTELWSIESLARDVADDLRPHMRYEVQFSRRVLVDPETAIANWTPDRALTWDASTSRGIQLAEFKARVTLEASAAPRNEAARLLIEGYKDGRPFDTIDRFVGRFVNADTFADLERAAEELNTELIGMRASAIHQQQMFGLWGIDDRPPTQVTQVRDMRSAVRVGQRLTRADLRDGRLADRRVYKELHEAAEGWLANLPEPFEKIPTLWLDGRSGAGKSAALLHVLAKLHQEDPERIILWLGPAADRVGEAIAWASDRVQEGHQVIIAVDDPMAAERQSDFLRSTTYAAAECERLRALPLRPGVTTISSPVILACGPVEQRESAEDDGFATLQITPLRLPLETADDLHELATWYKARTGRAPPQVSDDVLLVQRFFEWNAGGSVRDFAMRFRQRLERFNTVGEKRVFETVARILALGRLYAEYPAAALRRDMATDETLARAFHQLGEAEEHLCFESDPAGGEEGVRLTHPHLADAIYREWFGRPTDRYARGAHLQAGIGAALAQRGAEPSLRFAPLWAVSRLARGFDRRGRPLASELRERLDLIASELREALREIYRSECREMNVLSDLPVWLGLQQDLDLRLDPEPAALLMTTIEDTSQPAKGLRLSCHKLLQHARSEELPHALQVVTGLLQRLVEWRESDGSPWHDWRAVAEDVIYRGGGGGLREPLLRLVEQAPDWHPLGRCVLELVRRGEQDDAAVVAEAWLRSAPVGAPAWSEVLRAIRRRELPFSTYAAHALRFLVSQPNHGFWASIWEDLEATGDVKPHRLHRVGLAWVGVRTDHELPRGSSEIDGWGRVWASLFSRVEGPIRETLADTGLAWIRTARPEHGNWSHVWAALWASPLVSDRDHAALESLGISWLTAAPYHYGWSFVWHPLLNSVDAAMGLIGIGHRWLEVADPRHAGWGYVWETLLKRALTEQERAEILDHGERWLARAFNAKGWNYVFRLVCDIRPGALASLAEPALLQLASGDLDDETWVNSWRAVAERTTSADPWAAHLISVGEIWLERHPSNGSWGHVYARLKDLRRSATPAPLLLRAVAWLEAEKTGGSWPALFQAVFQETAALADIGGDSVRSLSERIQSAGRDRLRNDFGPAAWPHVWKTVRQAANDEVVRIDLDELADNWLHATPLDNRAWGLMWLIRRSFIGPAAPARDRLLRAGARWLEQAARNEQSWFHVWWWLNKYEFPALREPALINRQMDWLAVTSETPDRWSSVLLAVRGAKILQEPALFVRAEGWLERMDAQHPQWPSVYVAYHRALEGQIDRFAARADDLLLAQKFNLAGSAKLLGLRVTARRRAGTDPAPLMAAAEVWLTTSTRLSGWSSVYGQLRKLTQTAVASAAVVDAAVDWLLRNPAASDARFVVPAIMQFSRTRLSDAGHLALEDALERCPAGCDVWGSIWAAAVHAKPSPNRQALLARGLDWLNSAQMDNRRWYLVWTTLWKQSRAQRPILKKLAEQWLSKTTEMSPSRERVIAALADARK